MYSLRLTCKTLTAVGLLCGVGMAGAASKTSSFAVTTTVVANCFINSASAMTFGSYTAGTGNVDQTSSIVLRCSNTTTYGIGLDAGTGVGSTLAQRKMTIGAGGANNEVNYNLYTDAARTVLWANPVTAATAAGNQGGTGTGLGNTATHTVYGRLTDDATSQAATPSALYTSTVTLTINY
jgi:spore coat protein U-like protein